MIWPRVRLGQALETAPIFVDGDWVESKDQDPQGDVRLIQLADVGDGFYIDKSNRFLTSAAAERLKCTFLEPGDLLLARMPDPLGRACVFPGDSKRAVTVVDVCVIRVDKSRVDARWLMHCINSPGVRSEIGGYVTGTTRSRISRGNLSKVEIHLPPLPEQRRIAAILDQADALRAKRREALAQLDGLTQSIFIEMFGEPVANCMKWPELTFDQTLCDETSRATKTLQADYLDAGAIPVIDQGQKAVAGYVNEQAKLCPCELPVIVFGDHTRAVKLITFPFAVGADGAKVLVPKAGVSTVYVAHLLRLLPIPNLGYSRHMKELKRSLYPVPPIALQQSFATRIQAVESLKATHRAALAELDALFGSLQHRAFSGQL